jgi:uncharacterized protein YjbI with pentapeptide repeats
MSSQSIILAHDMWRKGAGGAPAGLVGQADNFAYAGLDLDLAQFAGSTFAGTSFAATSFKHAGWSACQFTGCNFTQCDFSGISITGCAFVNCTFSESQFNAAGLIGSTFTGCTWTGLSFDSGSWSQVDVLDCRGHRITASNLRGQQVNFTGSHFEELEFSNAIINN